MTTKKKRAPQDATLRNIRSTRRSVTALEERVRALELIVKDANGALGRLFERQDKLAAEAVARGWPPGCA